MVLKQVRSDRPVAEVAADLELSESTAFRWVRQDRIDRGELVGTPSAESTELRAAKRRVAELEAELATVKRASELFNDGQVVRPKSCSGSWRPWPVGATGQRGLVASSRWALGVLPMAVVASESPGHPPGVAEVDLGDDLQADDFSTQGMGRS